MTAHLGDLAVLGVAHPHTEHSIGFPQEADDLGGGADHGTVVRGRTCDGQAVARVVDDGVVVADSADEGIPLERGCDAQRARPGDMLLSGHRLGAAHPVVEEDAGRDVGPLPDTLGQRIEERQRLDQVRREESQRQFPLAQRLPHQAELELLEVAQAAVEHLRRPARCARRDVASLDERHPQSAGRGVQSSADADHATADDDDVELLRAEPPPRLLPVQRAHIRRSIRVELGGHNHRA